MTSGLRKQLPRVVEEAPGSAYEIDGMQPRFAARPNDIGGVSEAMRFAHEQGLAVVPWGGGTRMALGNVPDRYDLALDMTGLDRMMDHTPGDLTATAGAGMTIAALQESLGHHGQILAVDPPLPERATLGGTMAVGWSGPFKWQFGSIRDVVIGMKVVQADGTVTKSGGQVVKNVSGFDMARLHIGALGTLGVIVEVSLKLTPRPHGSVTLLSGSDRAAPCIEAALGVFSSGMMPLAITSVRRADRQRQDGHGQRRSDADSYLAIRLAGRPRAQSSDRSTRDTLDCRGNAWRVSPPDTLDGANEGASLWRGDEPTLGGTA